MSKTIKQIADELGVSKTAVSKQIANLGLRSSLRKIGNQFAIDNQQETLIRQAFEEKDRQPNRQPVGGRLTTPVDGEKPSKSIDEAVVDMLQRELEIKNKQIEDLNARLAESQKLLDQQQQLNAIAEQKLLMIEGQNNTSEGEKKPWWRFWN